MLGKLKLMTVVAEGKMVAEGVKEDTELNKLVEEHSSFFDATDS